MRKIVLTEIDKDYIRDVIKQYGKDFLYVAKIRDVYFDLDRLFNKNIPKKCSSCMLSFCYKDSECTLKVMTMDGESFKNMEWNKQYTLEELGL